jgi:hypothetical protein
MLRVGLKPAFPALHGTLGTRDEEVPLVAAARARPEADVGVKACACSGAKEAGFAKDARVQVEMGTSPLEYTAQYPPGHEYEQ